MYSTTGEVSRSPTRSRAGDQSSAQHVATIPMTGPGELVPDVRVGEWSMPGIPSCNGVGRLGPGIPKADFWASATSLLTVLDAVTINVGCGGPRHAVW
jgi:hypothetical protein